ncbi:thioredoxin domain-containing protein [Candidatus Woesearchaeota archaeon]|nr:thioredoxin domain-containing protein [Candidatus Woesearchaeota archaeon]
MEKESHKDTAHAEKKHHTKTEKQQASQKASHNPGTLLTVLLAVVLLLSVVNLYSTWTLHQKFEVTGAAVVPTAAPNNLPDTVPPTPTGAAAPIAVDADDDAVKGDENAPVEIIEFSDYECPFCARWYTQTYIQLKENYIDTGKVKLVFRDFPLGFHANAQKAAEAAECAGEQGKYYEMHDLLFENGVSGGVTAFKQYAATLGLDTEAFNSCLDSGQMAAEVAADMAAGQAAGVSGTPSFFINGVKLVGAQPYEAFQQIIDQQLAQ